ncbi:MarR family winged helix-turn-helix transcriptional regulator [Christensenellaceae bacterium OttesenSCG-928-L17]|nr:MarR family winged helix-turn-helix transcriptional regulator [Christensenellaceae bacterium OttesenSCG-928-L17]
MITSQQKAAVCTEKLHSILHLLRRRAMEGLEMHRGQLPVLEYIQRNPGCTQVEISQALLITPSSIAQSTKRMQRDDILEKHIDEENQRCKRLYVTKKGEALAAECRRRMDEVDENMFAVLSEEEVEQLIIMLEKLLQNAAEQADISVEEMDFFAFIRLKHMFHQCEEGNTKHDK